MKTMASSYDDFQGPYGLGNPTGGWVFPLALAAVHNRAGMDRRGYPQAFSTLTLSSKRTEMRKQKQ